MVRRKGVGLALAAACAACAASAALAVDAGRVRPQEPRQVPSGVQQGGHGPDGRGGPPSPERMFAEIDANRDGSISRSEFTAFHTARHAQGHRGPGGPDGPGGPGRGGPPPRDGGR